jgi:hypothetical protein
METKTHINNKIIAITMKIQEEFPELSKYIAEMPVTIPNIEDPAINIDSLNEYYNSLNDLLSKYTKAHTDISA